MVERKVADISTWNSEDNFNYDVFAKNIDGVILRAGFTGWGTGTECNEDSLLSTHIRNLRNKTNLGLYYFSTAMSESIAKKEARFCLDIIKKYNLDIKYPIYFDSENSGSDNGIGHQHLSVSELTNVAKAFCEEIEKAGYPAGIYASTSWLNNNMNMSQLDYAIWVADYRGYNGYGDAGMWQYTSEGRVKGYNGNIDLNIDYRDYPNRFKNGDHNSKKIQKSEWIKDKVGWWYKHADGSYTKKDWEKIDNKWYYFDEKGYMKNGWIKYKDTWYYLDEKNGNMISNEFRLINNKWYRFNEHGEMLEEAFLKVGKNGQIEEIKF